MNRETIQTVLALLNPLHGSLDRQTYDERVSQNFDAPRDAEYAVNVTAQQERDLTQAVLILENRVRETVAEGAIYTPSRTAFWVIETGRTTYWDGRAIGDAAHFTDKIDDAAKFWDFGTAEIARCWLLEKQSGAPKLRSVEHMYVPAIAMAS